MKTKIMTMLLSFLFIPIYVFAYSDYLIASGETIGVELRTDNVFIVGSYKIRNYDVLDNSDLMIGDKIVRINNYEVTSAKSLQNAINDIDSDIVSLSYIRNGEKYTTTIPLYREDGVLKTGLYVRDSIRGVASLTYIEPPSKENGNVASFGALGHEIVEKTSKQRFPLDDGNIFSSVVTGVTKSVAGSPGEKNARSDSNDILGTVSSNTFSGVFGTYTADIPKTKLYKVAESSEVKTGSAKILTVINGDKVEAFDINILKINNNSNTKNILFEVTDKKLLSKTGGIVQGMSGSPIIQGEYIIGAVNYVLVDSPKNGYGIFITNMLKEAEN